jgi:hypothetical protein
MMYWRSGCTNDGRTALYPPTDVGQEIVGIGDLEIDAMVVEEGA